MTEGYWLLLSNCHLHDDWSDEFLTVLNNLLAPTESQRSTYAASIASAKSDKQASLSSDLHQHPLYHNNFRLIFITETDTEDNLPAVVTKTAQFISLGLEKSHKDLVKGQFFTVF